MDKIQQQLEAQHHQGYHTEGEQTQKEPIKHVKISIGLVMITKS